MKVDHKELLMLKSHGLEFIFNNTKRVDGENAIEFDSFEIVGDITEDNLRVLMLVFLGENDD
jgi:hypothetical protein